MIYKECSKCKIIFFNSDIEENFYKRSNGELRADCKNCISKRQKLKRTKIVYDHCKVQYCHFCNKIYEKNSINFSISNKYSKNKTLYKQYRCKICVKNASNLFRLNNPEKVIYTSAKQRAKKKELEFNITLEDIVIPEYCPLLNIKLEKQFDKPRGDTSPSLDRIDNTKGYIKGNVWVISNKANIIKNSSSFKDFETIYLNWNKIWN